MSTTPQQQSLLQPPPPPPPPQTSPKFAIGGLSVFTFYHLLLLSFFVTVGRYPESNYFVFLHYGYIHRALYSQLLVIEVFYGFAFLASIPLPSDNIAVEFAGLMITNVLLSNHMIYMVNSTLFHISIAWWSLCIFLMLLRMTGDILKQMYAKIYPNANTGGVNPWQHHRRHLWQHHPQPKSKH